MFDIAWSEMALIAAVALVVIGPKDLPKVMRTVGGVTRKMRTLAGEFQRGVNEMAREAELDDLRKQVREAAPDKAALEAMVTGEKKMGVLPPASQPSASVSGAQDSRSEGAASAAPSDASQKS